MLLVATVFCAPMVYGGIIAEKIAGVIVLLIIGCITLPSIISNIFLLLTAKRENIPELLKQQESVSNDLLKWGHP